MTNPPVAIQARNLSKQFVLRHNRSASIKSRLVGLVQPRQRERLEPFWALRDLSLSIGRGEQVGLVGRNGSGKSTLLKLIAGIHRPTSGQLLVARGAAIGSMIELGVGFHPDLTGAENVFLNAAIHGRSRSEIEAVYPNIVEYSGLAHFMDVALKNYSSGMHLRLGFAVAANLDPDVLLLDEVFAVGDEDFQTKCMRTMAEFAEAGRTILFVSHIASAVRLMCRRVCVLESGRLQFDGDVEGGLRAYQELLARRGARRVSEHQLPEAVQAEQGEGLALQARRQLSAWAVELLEAEALTPGERVIEIGLSSDVDPDGPLVQHVGAERYAYWQAGAPIPPGVGGGADFDLAVAVSIFVHFPLNTIARIVAAALSCLPSGGRLYATFYEVPASQAFTPTPWPGGYVTSPELVPFQYSFDLLRGVVSALGASLHRVDGLAHPNGESTVMIRKS